MLRLEYPIVQGPFGSGLSSVALAAAVSNAGGLGSFGAHILSPEQIHATAAELRARTTRAFVMNLWVPLPGERGLTLTAEEFAREAEALRAYREELDVPAPKRPASYAAQDFEAQMEALIEARPPVASFVFGPPPPAAIAEMKRRGIVTMAAATTVEEAVALERAGIDVVIASGSDAGGHRPSFLREADESLVGTFSLVPQVADAVGVPVIAAGGIADGRGVAAALTLGADAAQVGTAFLACDESNASETHKAELVKPTARLTALTNVFTGRLARGVRTQFLEELEAHESEPSAYPARAWFMAPITAAAAKAGRADRLSLWSGQAAGLAKRRPAAECFAALVAETEQAWTGRGHDSHKEARKIGGRERLARRQ